MNQKQESDSFKRRNQFSRKSNQYLSKINTVFNSKRRLSHLTPAEIVELEDLNTIVNKDEKTKYRTRVGCEENRSLCNETTLAALELINFNLVEGAS